MKHNRVAAKLRMSALPIAALAFLSCFSSPSHAGDMGAGAYLSSEDGKLSISGDSYSNEMQVYTNFYGDFWIKISNTKYDMDAGGGCRLTADDTIYCGNISGIRSVRIALGPGDDALTIDIPTPTQVDAGTGDDTLYAGREISYTDAQWSSKIDLHGSYGVDTVDYSWSQHRVGVSLDGAADDGRPGFNDANNIRPDVENIVGSPFNDSLTGSSVSNRINGLTGVDMLRGGDGNDAILARDGEADQLLDCGGGDDAIWLDDNGTDPRPTGCERYRY